MSLYYEDYTAVVNGAQVSPQVANAIDGIVGGAQLEVRVGYFGICMQPGNSGFTCSQNASALASFLGSSQDPLNLIWVASTFKDAVVFPYLMCVSLPLQQFVCFLNAADHLYKSESSP